MTSSLTDKHVNKFVSNTYTDPTLLSFEFEINPRSLLFCEDEQIEPGSLDFYDKNNMLNDFGNGIRGVAAFTPHLLLKNLKEDKRDAMMMRFIQGFKFVLSEQQWRIQSIEGLDAVFTSLLNYKDGYTGSTDEKVTITCIEDVELTMYNLFELYRRSVYDPFYKRQLIPNNLLQFDCKVIISDRRNLTKQSEAPKQNNKAISSNTTYVGALSKSIVSSISPIRQTESKNETELLTNVYDKPVVELIFCNCKFDLGTLGKEFENINPGEADNNWNKFIFSFTFGKVYMRSSTVEDMQKWDDFRKSEEDVNKSNDARDSFLSENSKDKSLGATLSNLKKGGWDGAINSAANAGKEYLSKAISNETRKLENLEKKALGQSQGYELGNNIYGTSNFISAMGEKLGDKLSSLADEGLNKLKGATVGKLNGLISQGKATVEGAIATAESSLMSGGQKGAKTPAGSLQSPIREPATDVNPSLERLSGTERIYEETPTKSASFETYNIYENVPSGPKQ